MDHAAERLEALDRLKKLPKGAQVANTPQADDAKVKPAKKAAAKKPATKKSNQEALLIHDFE